MIILSQTGNSLEVSPGRPNFDPALTAGLPVAPLRARCHSISSNCISMNIVDAINICLNNNNARARTKCNTRLTGLMNAVCNGFAITPPLQTLYGDVINNATAEITQINIELQGNPINYANLVSNAALLLNALFSSPANLRVSSSSWNSSVQAAYDPIAWVHTNAGANITSSYGGLSGQTPIIGHTLPAYTANKYFLYDDIDCNKIHTLRTSRNAHLDFYTAKCSSPAVAFMYSSSNFGFSVPPTVSGCDDRVYYELNGAWERI